MLYNLFFSGTQFIDPMDKYRYISFMLDIFCYFTEKCLPTHYTYIHKI